MDNALLTLSVTQLCNYIKNIFDAEELLIGVSCFGEITNLKNSGRAIYFDLKDENSSLPCICFDDQLVSGIDFGSKVTVKGRLNYYTKTGKLSFVVSKIEKYGVGDLYKQYLQLKEKLEKEGIFDSRHKKQIPIHPHRIGVVSSETGAVINDIIKVARQKNVSDDIVLYPVKVQGLNAVNEIISGIKFFDNYNVDVIVVARGGGSFEDYQPFNNEELVRTVFMANKPVISAIGHENDWTLIDFVSDLRASTPSVASELVVFDELGLLKSLIISNNKFSAQIVALIDAKKQGLINQFQKQLSLLEKIIDDGKSKIDSYTYILDSLMQKKLVEAKNKYEIITTKIEKVNPISVIKRGYSKIEKNNCPIKSVDEVSKGEEIDVWLIDGKLKTKINDVEKIKWIMKK